MANFYKSETFDLTTTNLTTVLTINTSSIAIVKAVQASHANVSQVDVFELIFENATAFNQSLANWDISEMRFINKMLDN